MLSDDRRKPTADFGDIRCLFHKSPVRIQSFSRKILFRKLLSQANAQCRLASRLAHFVAHTVHYNPVKYYYLKLGPQNTLVNECLVTASQKSVCIFFGNTTENTYSSALGAKVVQDFIDAANEEVRNAVVILVIHEGQAWFLTPTGNVTFGDPEATHDGALHNRKSMPVRVLGGGPKQLLNVPSIISGIPSNQYLGRGTFREIKNDWGCKKAIDIGAGLALTGEHWEIGEQGEDQLLECLGSLELETLIAKIFEAAGFFVPAYRGGLIKDIDLFVKNDTGATIDVAGLKVTPGGVTIQVKRWPSGEWERGSANFMIGTAAQGDRCFGSSWILRAAASYMNVWDWLSRSLAWLPLDFRQKITRKLKLGPLI